MKDTWFAGRCEGELRQSIDAWRRQQPDSIPTLSSAVNTLVRIGLDVEAQRKPKTTTA